MTDAPAPSSQTTATRRVAIDPLTRVEGHGKVTLQLDASGRVIEARLHIVEFRGFEKFIQGRPYWEVPVMVQRLCGICPVSHQLAAAKALDQVIGATTLPPAAEQMRRLMHYGQILQSHALHFFHLAAPDLLFGFDAEPARRNLVGVIQHAPAIARQGIALRRFGQQVIEATAGKRIHGTGAIPGGVNWQLSPDQRHALLAQCPEIIASAQAAVRLTQTLYDANPTLYRDFGRVSSHGMSLVRSDGALDLYDGQLRVRLADGRTLFDHFDTQTYWQEIHETVKPWSYMKFPYLQRLGEANGWYRVGPLTRMNLCDFIPSPHAEAARQVFLAHDAGAARDATLATHWARMIEMLHAAEVIAELLATPLPEDAPLTHPSQPGERRERGVGVLEAPRGTLIHHYRVDANDLVIRANLIVSTTHNNQVLNETIRAVAHRYLDGQEITEALLNHIEVAIRAFDPCLSCSTHALGQMPLQVMLFSAMGHCIQHVTRQ